MRTCPYCMQETASEDWHGCDKAQAAKTHIEELVESMSQMYGNPKTDDSLIVQEGIRIHVKKRKVKDWIEEKR